MTLIWPKQEADIVTNQPRTHALVIGVANYPHLNGGAGALANDPLGLGQVTTPAFTARAITEWLERDFKNAGCPIGSIECLLSSAAPEPGDEAATMAACEVAANRWVQRCSSHAGNVALFYFCGHGLARDEQYLLPEDFGNPAFADAWRNCIDFDGLRAGMRAVCRAETQIFFVDACRETPFAALTQQVNGQPLIGGDGFTSAVKSHAVYFATTEGKQAFGPANGKTYFSEAVLSCFQGLGGVNTNGQWVVNTYSLSMALGHLMDYFAEQHRQPLTASCDVNGAPVNLHQLETPLVLAAIECANKNATAVADIELRGGGQSYRSKVEEQKPLTCRVAPGQWEVLISFPGGQFTNSNPIPCLLYPPIFEGVAYP